MWGYNTFATPSTPCCNIWPLFTTRGYPSCTAYSHHFTYFIVHFKPSIMAGVQSVPKSTFRTSWIPTLSSPRIVFKLSSSVPRGLVILFFCFFFNFWHQTATELYPLSREKHSGVGCESVIALRLSLTCLKLFIQYR